MSAATIQQILALAGPVSRPQVYARYLGTLDQAALQRKLTDLQADKKARTEPVKFWRPGKLPVANEPQRHRVTEAIL